MLCLLVVCTAAPVAAAGNRLLENMNDARLRCSFIEEPGATDPRGHRPIAVRQWAGWGVSTPVVSADLLSHRQNPPLPVPLLTGFQLPVNYIFGGC